MPGVYEDRGGTVTNYHSGIKNSFMQTSAAGSQTAAKRYDAFGNVLASSGTWQGRFAYGGPHGYQTDASLQLLGDRYYDPSLGRFLTRDIAKDGRNWYVYCGNDPIAKADPAGRLVFLLVVGAFALFTVLGTNNAEAPMVTDTPADRERHGRELNEWKLQVANFIVGFMLGSSGVRAAKLSVAVYFYKNVGGCGVVLKKAGKRVINFDVHPWHKPGQPNEPWWKWPHINKPPKLKLHWPWER
jgi:RHS repeat-associated protein